jgi:hypothetical protein
VWFSLKGKASVIKFCLKRNKNMKRLLWLATGMILISFGFIAHGAGGGSQDDALIVKNWKGKYIGSIKHVLVDPPNREITFVILSLGKEGKKEIAVPLHAFSYDHKNGILVLNASEEDLATAPEFHVSDLNDPTFAEKVYRFFGQAPSWTDGRKEGEIRM